MYNDTINVLVAGAGKKLELLRRSPGSFFIASMLAGAYVGLAIILIFTLGSQLPPEVRKLAMGATFGIALVLVVIAGAELFTGHTMIMALRRYQGQGTWGDVAALLSASWLGNLCGAALLVGLFVMSGGVACWTMPKEWS